MKDIDFTQIGLIALLFSSLFVVFGLFGLFYGAFCDAIVLERYYAACFSMGFLCIVASLVFLIVDLLTE
jgi:hypothetical protein